MKTADLQYHTDKVMTCTGVGQLRSFFKKLGMEMHLAAEDIPRGQMKIGERRMYNIWCNTNASRRIYGAKCIVVRRGRSEYVFRIREL